jgi:hypothetical protein
VTSVYVCEGTTSRVMVANRPYGEFYDIYSTSPEYFGYHHVHVCVCVCVCVFSYCCADPKSFCMSCLRTNIQRGALHILQL